MGYTCARKVGMTMYHVFAVSDGSGRTVERALIAAMTQFAGAEVETERQAEVRTEEQVRPHRTPGEPAAGPVRSPAGSCLRAGD